MTTYLTDSEVLTGKFIPASQRPDGTWRKARRVKQGYVPQEEVPLYESKGKQFANRKSNIPVGMCPLIAEAEKKEREKQQRSKIKLQQNQANRKNTPGVLILPKNSTINTDSSISNSAAPKKKNHTTEISTISSNPCNTNSNSTSRLAVDTVSKDLNVLQISSDDPAKKLKKLRKKIREIETIEAKIKSGELKKPEKDQLDKIKRKQEILKEIKIIEEEYGND